MFNAIESHDKILIDGLKCLRVEYLYNECSLCIEICPEEAITLGKNKRIALDPKKCTDCSACISVCPTSAISNTEFDPNMFALKFSTEDEDRLSCKNNTPCLNIFNAEQFLSLGLRNKSVICDMSHCEGCETNKNGTVETSIKSHIDEANIFLKAMKVESRITTDYKEPIEVTRRELFRKFTQGVNELQNDRKIGEAFNKNNALPVHRQLLQNSLKRVIENVKQTTIHQVFSFTANKQIDFQSCTNCGECVQFCPTNALTYSSDKSRILFQNLHCIACGVCDDICKPNSFSSKPELDLMTMAFDRAVIAVEHHFVICSECKTAFPQKNDETICTRCVDFVEVSKDLFALARDL